MYTLPWEQGDLADLGADDDEDGEEEDAENGGMNGDTARGGALSDSGEPSTSGATLVPNSLQCSSCPLHRPLRA